MSVFSNIAVSALSGAAAAGAVVLAGSVSLQATSPGTPDVGNSNVSGNSIAGRFGANTTPTLARVQVNETGSLQGVRSLTGSGVSVYGQSTATSGLGTGGYFTSASTGGRAIVGDALSATGNTVGGLFYNRSAGGGVGVWGRAIGGGTATGVFGETTSATGTALAASNSATGDSFEAGSANGSLLTKGTMPKHQYSVATAAAMVPIAYGVVTGNGAIDYAGSDNWTVTKTGTGQYTINVAGVSFTSEAAVVSANAYEADGSQFCSVGSQGGDDVGVNVWDVSAGALADSDFEFVIYRSLGTAGPPMPANLINSDQSKKYGGREMWEKKDPAGFEAWRKASVAWQRSQLAARPFGVPVDGAARP